MYIIEGMKYSPYPKVEVVRQEISDKSVCDDENSLICIATDVVSQKDVKCPVYDMDDVPGFFYALKDTLD